MQWKGRKLKTIGDLVGAVLAVDNVEDAAAFYAAHSADIQAQMDRGQWNSPGTAEDGARSNIGWCFGEGMAPERIAMWVKTTGSAHPVFGTMDPPPTPEEAYQQEIAAGALDALRDEAEVDPDLRF